MIAGGLLGAAVITLLCWLARSRRFEFSRRETP